MEQYFVAFLEGFANFVSPCILPVLPALIAYILKTGTSSDDKKLKNLLFFVLGFTIIFVALGVLASSFGSLISRNLTYINIVFGIILIILSLNYLGVYKIPILNKEYRVKSKEEIAKNEIDQDDLGNDKPKKSGIKNALESIVMGIFFALVWTPCTGPFLTSALIKATNSGSELEGGLILFIYSLGISIPLVLAAIMLDNLKSVFTAIKKNYKIINIISGLLLLGYGLYLLIYNIQLLF